MRLTAMFVARNGRQFLTQLMNREVRNFQFDFLKPQHSNFPYFTKLVEQYTKVGFLEISKCWPNLYPNVAPIWFNSIFLGHNSDEIHRRRPLQ